MKVIKEKTINKKLAQLILEDDNITVSVLYDGNRIDSSAENTWNNLKDEDWIQDAYIDLVVDEVLENKTVDLEFLEAVKELD